MGFITYRAKMYVNNGIKNETGENNCYAVRDVVYYLKVDCDNLKT